MSEPASARRRATLTVRIGAIEVGGSHPVVVQSMTNTDTADVASTVKQVAELWRAGSELVRVTVNNAESAAAVPRIVDKLAMMGVEVPIVGDFHYNGHQLLAAEPACAQALAKYRINPGNVGFGRKRDSQFASLIELAIAPRQAGAHRRQLGLARPGAGGAADGRERTCAPNPGRPAACCARRWCARRSTRRSAPIELGLPERPHHPVGEGQRGAGTDRGLPRPRRALATCRCTWA